MSFSTTMIRPFRRAVALAAATAMLVVPAAEANVTPTNIYGSLDPWAYNLIHAGALSMPLRTEHSAGQNGTVQPIVSNSGGLDPWARNVLAIHSAPIPLISEHSAGQNHVNNAVRSTAPAVTSPSGVSNRFDWTDAGIGAGGALAVVLFAATGTLVLRRRRALAHVQV
jgi:hypothetical protein